MLFFNKNENKSIEYKVLEEYKKNIDSLISSDNYISKKDYIHFYDGNKEIVEKLVMMNNESVLQTWCKNNKTDYTSLKALMNFYTNTETLINNHNSEFIEKHLMTDSQYLDEILQKYNRLINILSLYRLTLGQPRQEELLDSVLIDFDIDKKELDELFINLSPYYKNI